MNLRLVGNSLWFTTGMQQHWSRWTPWVCAAALVSCGGGGGDAAPPGPSPGATVVAEASIGPEGGTLTVGAGANAGLELSVPPGAVAVPTSFRVLVEEQVDEIPRAFPVYRFEPGAVDLNGKSVTVTVPASEIFFANGAPELAIFSRDDSASGWRALTPTTVDVAAQVATATTQRLGEMVVWEGNLHRLFTQPNALIDPAVATGVEVVAGVEVLAEQGSIQRQVGKGSLASFWGSPASDNVVILHGALGSPLDFLGAVDLVDNLAQSFDNVVLFSCPSARGVAYAANALYDQIQANRGPGFGCSVVGHSLGGLIGRYLLEQSHVDPNRAGYRSGDPSLVPTVEELVMIAPPNAGAASATGPFALLQGLLAPGELHLIQAASDLSEAPGSLPFVMNAAYLDNATRYHVVYGDIGDGSDGVVQVASALALPLGAGETATMFVAQHDDLHRQSSSLGVAVLIEALLQVQ